MKIIGKWTGEYQLNPEYYEENKSIKFEIEILSFENGKFQGKVNDDVEMGGTPGEGIIEGGINGNQFNFIKKMPINSFISKNNEHLVNENKKHPFLYYSGILNNFSVEGNWTFKKKFMWIGILPWWYNLGNGTFKMNKIN